MAPDWAEALAPVDERIAAMGQFLRAELAAGRGYLPAGDDVFKAFRRPLADVRVLIVGQDPYPTPGSPDRAVVRGRPRRAAAAGLAAQHLPGAVDRPRHPAGAARRPDGLGRPRRDAAEPGADRPARRVRVAPRPRLGGGHRRARSTRWSARRPDRGDPVGSRRAVAQAGARRRSRGWSRCTRRRSRRRAASSARGRSPGSTGCSSSRVATRSTGRCRHDLTGGSARRAEDPWPEPVMTAGARHRHWWSGPGCNGGSGPASRNKVEYAIIWPVMTDRMPALYIGHGAPPLLDDPLWSSQLAGLAADLPAPEGDPDRQRPLGVRAGDAQRATGAPLVYDFGGFAAKYYRMTYDDARRHRAGRSGSRR